MPSDLGALGAVLQLFVAFFGAYLLAVWIGLIVWTFRDIRARTNDLFTQLLSVALVVIFSILYFLLRPHDTLADAYERELTEEAMLQDIEDKQVCPVCHQKIQPAFLFCPSCHTKLKRECDQCHHALSLRWTLCPYCGHNVTSAAPPNSPQPI